MSLGEELPDWESSPRERNFAVGLKEVEEGTWCMSEITGVSSSSAAGESLVSSKVASCTKKEPEDFRELVSPSTSAIVGSPGSRFLIGVILGF